MALAFLLALPVAAPAAAKSSGHLDYAFGTKGKLLLPSKLLGPKVAGIFQGIFRAGSAPGIATKLLPAGRGRFLLANRDRIFRFEADGQLDRTFGHGGYVTIEPPAGQQWTPRDVAVDPSGRILVAGEVEDIAKLPEKVRDPEQNFGGYGPPVTRAAVMRLLPNGRADKGFGNAGVVESTLGLPPPSYKGQSYRTPSVQGLAIASDPVGRPVLAGSFVTESLLCYPLEVEFATRSFVARFSTNGVVKGVSTGPAVAPSSSVLALTAGTVNRLVIEEINSKLCARLGSEVWPSIAMLKFDGPSEARFAPVNVSLSEPVSFAWDRRGRLLIFGLRGTENESGKPYAMRLRANGSLDQRFGHDGTVNLRPFAAGFGPVAIDAKNRAILGGGLRREGEIGSLAEEAGLSLSRLTAHGQIDRAFGNGGIVRIPFRAAGNGSASAVMVDGAGGIVVAGPLSAAGTTYPESMIGVARYLPDG